ncbi:MAG: aminoglycoside 6-adenylyltransferase [Chloroflexia bacterium]|nr:aminoglycoside 6-adenylyltransferase [Chloroflexia bacterium]
MTDRHAELIERLMAWARADENIRALVQTGSAARQDGSADRFSDRDIEVIARDREPLLASDAWFHAIGPVMVALRLENGDFFDTRLVFYEGGRKIDFTVADRSRLDAMIGANRLDDLYARGYRVLLDKDGLAARLPASTGSAPRRALPAQDEFAATVTEFWFEVAHMPTYLVRDEGWVVKFRDWTMKEMLLRMLEWHALATGGPETDTWHIGTKLRRWVDVETWDEVHEVFSRFDRADTWRGLVATIGLFTRLTRETAAALGFAYPIQAEQSVTAYVLGFEDEIARLDGSSSD